MKTIGSIVKAAREKRQVERKELAKKLNISEGYLGHIERDALVRVSENIAVALKKELKVNVMPLLDQHNVHVSQAYKNRTKKSA